ncbi:hypothetical protein ACM26W_01145 [Halomonas sp. HK25]|uniref:hypothetical protein n=1 Tax=Halomonas sp. HK25 TaxID=3394321 RepID=UPI0039FD21F6
MRQKMTDHRPRRLSGQPTGTLQDAGEVAVLTPNQGETHHRFAMVVAFDSEAELRRALKGHACRYRNGQRVEELTHE